jgi:hypothetical protein
MTDYLSFIIIDNEKGGPSRISSKMGISEDNENKWDDLLSDESSFYGAIPCSFSLLRQPSRESGEDCYNRYNPYTKTEDLNLR